jgi:hemolysin activation/secretion protein
MLKLYILNKSMIFNYRNMHLNVYVNNYHYSPPDKYGNDIDYGSEDESFDIDIYHVRNNGNIVKASKKFALKHEDNIYDIVSKKIHEGIEI